MTGEKCAGISSWLWLIVGVLFLLADLGVWNWGISWWTAAFLVCGLMCVASSYCKRCQKKK